MDPALLQQILGAGPLAEQQTQADQQLQDLITRRRAMVAQPSYSGAGALLGGIANIIMGKRENEARAKQADLATKMASIRGQYGQALLGTPMGPAAPPGMPDNPPRIPLSPEDQGQLSMAAEMSGDPLMAKAGAGALSRAQQAPKLALETEQARKAQEARQAISSPAGALLLRGVASKFAPGVDVSNAPPETLNSLMPTLEKGFGASETAAARREAAQQSGELRRIMLSLQNQRFEQTTALRDDQFAAKRSTQMAQAINPLMPRGGLKNYADSINRAQKLAAVYYDPATGGAKAMLTPQDMVEGTIALQQLVANGHASQHEVDQLVPKGMGSDTARLLQYFTNKPWDAGQQAWAIRQLHIAQREADVNRGTIVNALKAAVPQFNDFREKNPDKWAAILKGQGLNPEAFDEEGLPIEGKDVLIGTNPVLSGDVTGGQGSTAVRKFKRVNGKLVEVK